MKRGNEIARQSTPCHQPDIRILPKKRSLIPRVLKNDALIQEIALAASRLNIRNRVHLLMLIDATQKHQEPPDL